MPARRTSVSDGIDGGPGALRRRSRWLVFVAAPLLVAGAAALLAPALLPDRPGPDSGSARLEAGPPRAEEPPVAAPILTGRPPGSAREPAAPASPAPPGRDLLVRFVVEGTRSGVPDVEWEVRNDHLRANAAGGWTFDSRGKVVGGKGDLEGRAVVPAAAVEAWRTHEFYAKRHLFHVRIVDDPPADAEGEVEIPLDVKGCAVWGRAVCRCEGRVLDDRGRGIPHAVLLFGGGAMEWPTRTDGEGRFDASFPVGEQDEAVSCVVAAPGRLAHAADVPARGASGLVFRLEEDTSRALLTLRLVRPDGTAAGGAWVHVRLPRGLPDGPYTGTEDAYRSELASQALDPWHPRRGTSGADGRFSIPAVAPGEATVSAHDGDLFAVCGVVVRTPETQAEVRLEQGRTVRGSVAVECEGRCGSERHVTSVGVEDPDGAWSPLHLRLPAPGPFELRGFPSSLDALLVGVAGHPVRRVTVPAVEPRGAGTVDLGEIAVPPGRLVSGHVWQADGTPLTEARISIRQEDGSEEHGWVNRGTFRVLRVWRPTSVAVKPTRGTEVDVTGQVDLDADEWTIRLP